MFTAYVIVTVVAVAVNAANVTVDVMRPGTVRANAAEVGVPASWIPWLAALKAAGAAGLLLGLLGAQAIGLAAAVGLVLYYIGAVAVHVRKRVFHNIAFPAGFLASAAAALLLGVLR